ncbi:GHKL domain-containing protein [[Clostridium] scindens]|uniref:GHKL domain-containing protein n=1 Tax=Clostridium scindens (strain JCM 10418 / VPI 12708) TaxID=29347 RepID=UPI00298C6F9C|nr:GHKL domain-containing protein [[Clostridium] scindens]WPB32550.1 hypothetical protein HCEICBPK_01308 [[Clostridium] scindens]
MTFFVDIGAYRIFGVLAMMIVFTLICYKVSIHNAVIVMELAYLLITPLSEATGISIMSLLYQGDIMAQVDGVSILKWQIYVFVILLKALYAVIAYHLLKNFKYEIQAKDTAVLSVSFLLVFVVSFASTYGYLNLGESDTLILDVVTSVLGVVFIVQFLYSRNVSYLREQEQRDKMQIAQLQQQYAYYQDKLKDEERIRSIYHDMKNHLLVLEGSQGTEATRQMAQELRSQIASYEDYIHTGNSFLDIIIRDKAEKAREKQIDFSAFVDFRDEDFIDPLDISTLFGNGIDNAIEASEKLAEEQRVILVKAGKIQDFVSILIENNCLDTVYAEGHTTKTDKFLHGFGISNMKKSAEKYGGTCTTAQADGKFTLKILLPVTKN